MASLLVDGLSAEERLLLILFTFRMKLFIEELILELVGIAAFEHCEDVF